MRVHDLHPLACHGATCSHHQVLGWDDMILDALVDTAVRAAARGGGGAARAEIDEMVEVGRGLALPGARGRGCSEGRRPGGGGGGSLR